MRHRKVLVQTDHCNKSFDAPPKVAQELVLYCCHIYDRFNVTLTIFQLCLCFYFIDVAADEPMAAAEPTAAEPEQVVEAESESEAEPEEVEAPVVAEETPAPAPAPAAEKKDYDSMDLEDKAFNILVDLGMVDETPDPDSPDYDHSNDDEFVE